MKISRPATDSDGSLTDEILMLGRPEPEAAKPTVVPALHAPRRRIIFAAAAAVVLAGCATLAGSLSATGSKSPRPVPQAAPQAAAPNQPTPAPAKPTQAGLPKIRPAPRHKPAPTRPPVQVAAPGVPHVQPATTRPRTLRPNSSPRPPTLIPTAQAARTHSARTLLPTWTRQGRASGKSRPSSRTYRARPTLFQGSSGCPVHRMSSDHQHVRSLLTDPYALRRRK